MISKQVYEWREDLSCYLMFWDKRLGVRDKYRGFVQNDEESELGETKYNIDAT